MTIRIFIADDHAIVREGLRLLLQTQPDFAVVGEAGNGRDAVAGICGLRPNAALLDIAMPELNGIEAARQITACAPATKVIILSMYGTSEHIHQARRAGAVGFIVKESAGAEVVQAIRTVGAGGNFWSETIAPLLRDVLDRRSSRRVGKSPLERLSGREREILQLVVEGATSAAIAGKLGLSPKTVETYRCRLMVKLDLQNIPQLVKFAVQHHLTPPGGLIKGAGSST